MRNGSLWSDVVFEKEVVFREFDFETSSLELEVSKSSIMKSHNFVWEGCFFLSYISRNFDDQLSWNFHRFVISCICWDTASEITGLWQLPIVSNVFKHWTLSRRYVNFVTHHCNAFDVAIFADGTFCMLGWKTFLVGLQSMLCVQLLHFGHYFTNCNVLTVCTGA